MSTAPDEREQHARIMAELHTARAALNTIERRYLAGRVDLDDDLTAHRRAVARLDQLLRHRTPRRARRPAPDRVTAAYQ